MDDSLHVLAHNEALKLIIMWIERCCTRPVQCWHREAPSDLGLEFFYAKSQIKFTLAELAILVSSILDQGWIIISEATSWRVSRLDTLDAYYTLRANLMAEFNYLFLHEIDGGSRQDHLKHLIQRYRLEIWTLESFPLRFANFDFRRKLLRYFTKSNYSLLQNMGKLLLFYLNKSQYHIL